MALINCPECNREISNSTKVCPNCGYKLKGKSKVKAIIIAIVAIVLVLAVAFVSIIGLIIKEEYSDSTSSDSISYQEQIEDIEETIDLEKSNVEETESEETESSDNDSDIDPNFKAAMDEYESFYAEYCDFLKKYADNPTDITLLSDYADMMSKAEEMDKAFEEWDEDDLNNEELKYYLDVNNRVMKMLADVEY